MNVSEIEANIGKIVIVRTSGAEWEAVLNRRSPNNGHWEVKDPEGKIVAITAKQILGLKEANKDAACGRLEPAAADADRLPDDSWGLAELAAFVVGSLRRTAIDGWWIGKAFLIARAKHKQYRDWLRWLKEDVDGLSKSTAYRYMDICTTFKLEEVRGKSLSVLYKLMEAQRKNNAGDEGDDDDGAEPEDADHDGTDPEEQNGAGDDSDDDLLDDTDSEEPEIAGKSARKASLATDSDHNADGEQKVSDEPQPPVTGTELDALTAFVEAVGGLTRAEYVFEYGIEQIAELGDEN